MTEDNAPYDADQPDQGFRVYSRIELPTTTVLNSILKRYGPMMGAYGKAIYLDLCMAASTNRICWLTHKELVDSNTISETTVKKYLKILVDLGLLIKKYNKISNNRNAPNTYILVDPESSGFSSDPLPAENEPDDTMGVGSPDAPTTPIGGGVASRPQEGSSDVPNWGRQTPGNNVFKDVITNKNNNVVVSLDDLFKKLTTVYDKYPRNVFLEQYNISLELCGADEYRALVYLAEKIQVLLERDPRKVRSAPALLISAIQRNWTPNTVPADPEPGPPLPPQPEDVPAPRAAPSDAQESEFSTWPPGQVISSFETFANIWGFKKALEYADGPFSANPHWAEIRAKLIERKERGEL